MKKLKKRKTKSSTKCVVKLRKVSKKTTRKSITADIQLPVKITEIVSVKKKKVPVMYFTPETEAAIIEYNNTENASIRNKIYTEKIQHAFEKISENIFNTFKFSYNEVCPLRVQQEAVAHMVSNISKYNPTKGAGKSFGYFSIVAKNWLILSNAVHYKRFKTHTEIVDEPVNHGEFIIKPEDETIDRDNLEFVQLLVKYWDDHLESIFQKQIENMKSSRKR